jgi:proline iminopeptidase
MADSELARMIVDAGRTVITFDPPGAYASTRVPSADIDEMIECGKEALDVWSSGAFATVDVAGHSMGGLCALAFAIENPDATDRLLLLNTTSGFSAVKRWGIHTHWRWYEREFWQVRILGTKLILGIGSQRDHDRLSYLNEFASYVDKTLVPPAPGQSTHAPAPARDAWLDNVRSVNLYGRLSEVRSPTLITVGRYDPQTPPHMAEELEAGIVASELVVFEESGHYPFIEESRRFRRTIVEFLED